MDPQAYRIVDMAIEELTNDDKLTAERLTYVVGILRGALIMSTLPENLDGEEHVEKHGKLLDLKAIGKKFLP